MFSTSLALGAPGSGFFCCKASFSSQLWQFRKNCSQGRWMRGERQEWEHIHQESLRLSPFSPLPLASPQIPSPKLLAHSTCDMCNWGRRGAGYSIQKMHQSADSPKPNPEAPGTCPDLLQLEADGLGTKLLIYLFPLLPRPHSNPQSRSRGRAAPQPPNLRPHLAGVSHL